MLAMQIQFQPRNTIRNRILHLGGDQYSYVDLGTNYDISHRHQLPQKIEFSVEWIPKLISQENLVMIAEIINENNKEVFKKSKYQSSLRFKSVVTIDNDQTSFDFIKYSFRASDNRWNHVGMNLHTQNKENMTYELCVEGDLLQAWMTQYEKEFGGLIKLLKTMVSSIFKHRQLAI